MLVLAAVLAMAGSVPPSDLGTRFTQLLERDDRAVAAAAAGPDADLGAIDWVELRDVIEKYDCIDVRTASAAIDTAADDAIMVRVDVAATAITLGENPAEILLPGTWFITFARVDDGWRMKSARTLESRLVDRIVAAKDDAARWELLREPGIDPVHLATSLGPRIQRNFGLWPFVREFSASMGVLAIEANSFGWAAIESRCDPETAAELLQKSEELARKSGNPDAIARAHIATGFVYWLAGNVPEALAAFERCAAMARRVRDPRPSLQALHMLVHLEMGRGNVTAAAGYAQRNADESRALGWEEGSLNAASNMERIHSYLGNRGEAAAASRQVLRGATAIARRDLVGTALFNLAVAEDAAGNYDEALALLKRAGARFYGAAGRVPEKTGDVLMHQGKYDEAEAQYLAALKRAKESSDEMAGILLLTNLSRLAALRQRFDEALAFAREALAVSESEPSIREVAAASPWLPRSAEGAALAALGRSEEAAAAYEQALAMIDNEQRIGAGEASPAFLDGRIEPFVSLVRLRVAQGAAAEALSVSERMKARVLRDLLDRGQVDLRAMLTREERAREEGLNRRLVELNRAVVAAGAHETAALRDALDQARAEQRAFAVITQLAHPEARRTVSPPTAEEVQDWIDRGRLVPSQDSVILDYVVGDRETTLFALARDAAGGTEVRMVTIPIAKKELARSAGRLVSRIERRELGYSEAAEELYRRLIAPVEPMLAGKTNISIIPHGTLWQLPFAVLRAPDGKHLLERASIHYAPSLAYLSLYAGRSQKWLPENPRVLALGNPAIGDPPPLTRAELGDLPEATVEAREIGELYGAANVLVEGAATEEAVKAAAAGQDILHFATHAIAQSSQPLYSNLVLATRSANEDGLLEAREIVRMNLSAQLAVLSACETARGGIAEGEGVIGLSWAFLVAGCPRTVVTQWRADSAAAAKAMIHFHRRLARTEGGGSVAGALRDAQLLLLRTPRYSHPYYWGGFVVVGAGW